MARKSRKGNETTATPEPHRTVTRLGGYVRLSAEDRKQGGNSIENQQAIINSYVAGRHDLELARMYIDDGATGQKFDRPAFQRMLADMEGGEISGCISKDLSRLGRNSIDTGYYVEKYFPTRGLRYIAINDNYDSADGRGGGMTVALKNLINESYALEVGRKVHATRQMNISKGLFVGAFAPYGYLKDPDDGHRLVPDPYAAGIVKSIFEMFAGGCSTAAIRDSLNERKVMPPMAHRHANGGAAVRSVETDAFWVLEVIYEMLRNRVYCGDMVQGRRVTKQYVTTRRKPSEFVVVADTHEPIVSRELFEAVQARKRKRVVRRADTQRDIFAGKLRCGHCGYALHNSRGKQAKYDYYVCNTRYSHGKNACVPVSIGVAVLRTAVYEVLRKHAEAFLDGGADTEAQAAGGEELRAVRGEIDRAGGFLKGLYESLSVGDITLDEYREMKSAYEARVAKLTERERELREAARLAALESARRVKATDAYGALAAADGLTADVVDALIEGIAVFQGKRIEIAFKYADETATVGGYGNE
jgi:DNA invertase Pin-like site-specific DNA recombinase